MAAWTVGGTPSPDECKQRALTAIGKVRLAEGAEVCAVTTGGRTVLIRVDAIDWDYRVLHTYTTVWDDAA